MAWESVDPSIWDEQVRDLAETLPDPNVTRGITMFELIGDPATYGTSKAAFHDGPLTVDGDFKPPALFSAIYGDLNVTGQIDTVGVDGFDGGATLVVFGSVTCGSIQNDWASLILIAGDLTARDFVFTGREDGSMLVGGDFRTRLFIGYDIWVELGGSAEIEAGIGYAKSLSDGSVSRPRLSVAETLALLKLADNEEAESIIDRRLYDTGSPLQRPSRRDGQAMASPRKRNAMHILMMRSHTALCKPSSS